MARHGAAHQRAFTDLQTAATKAVGEISEGPLNAEQTPTDKLYAIYNDLTDDDLGRMEAKFGQDAVVDFIDRMERRKAKEEADKHGEKTKI